MSELRFEWNPRKSQTNCKKHRVTFVEAQSAFCDEDGLFMNDTEYSDVEDRFLLLGMSSTLRELVVSHCYRENDGVIRIISARRATQREKQQYRSRKR